MTNLYIGHDVKSDIYSPPLTMDTDEQLQQFLHVLVNTHGTGHYHLYPEDYVFYQIAEFDEDTGLIELVEKRFAVNLAGLKKPCKECNQFKDDEDE